MSRENILHRLAWWLSYDVADVQWITHRLAFCLSYDVAVIEWIKSLIVPRRKSKGTIVLGSSVRPSVRPPVRPSVSPSVRRRHNLVSATPPTVFKGFCWNFRVIVPTTWRWSYFIEVMLDWFLPELWPFSNFSTVSLVSATPLAVFGGFSWYLPVIVPMTWRGSYCREVRLDGFLPVWELWPFVSLSTDVFVSATPPTCLKGFWWNFPVIVSMTWRWSYYWGHARLTFTRVMTLWQYFKGKFCLCESIRSFQWILMIPSSYCSHDLKRIILYCSHAWLLFTRDMALAIITIDKPCLHNILRIAWARILIFSIWVRINVYMTWLTFEQIPWKRTKLCPFYDSGIIAIEKPCQHDILRTAWARMLILSIQFRINV